MQRFQQSIVLQRGLTLIEIMVALGLAALIATAMASLLARSFQSRAQVERDGQKIESGRYALETLAEDIKLAGFYGDLMPVSETGVKWPLTSVATPVMAATTWTAVDPCATAVGSLGWNGVDGSIPVAVFGYQAPTASFTCLPNRKAGTDVIVVRRVSSVSYQWNTPTAGVWNASIAGANPVAGQEYLQASSCGISAVPDPQRFSMATLTGTGGSAPYFLRKVNCETSADLAQIRRYIHRIYYIATCDECVAGATEPDTLKVAELVGGTFITRSVATGIENLHFEYGVDTSGDGSPDSYAVSNIAPTVSSPFGWQNVMSVKAWVLVRDLTQSEQTIAATYTLGALSGQQRVINTSDRYRRAVFSSTIRVINPSAARETP